MFVSERFSENVIEQIAKVLGEAVKGSEIARFLRESGITEAPCGSSTKWCRLNASFVANQNSLCNASAVCVCIEKILAPVRFIAKGEEFALWRTEINKVLSFVGYELTESGYIKVTQKATKLSEAENRATSLHKKLEARGAHHLIFKFCSTELLQENYFHTILEASKSVFDRIREETGSLEDGAKLIDEVFCWNKPKLIINGHCSDSERSEYVGFGNFLKAVSSLCRNPVAHSPKIHWAVHEADALDLLTLISYIHRRLDNAQRTCLASHDR